MMTGRRTGPRPDPQTLGALLLLVLGLAAVGCSSGPTATVPAPREEGWWRELHRRHLERAGQGPVDLLFLGDSITQGWNDNEVWRTFYGPRRAANFGINGDKTQNVLWRIRDGELDGIGPKAVVLLIGTNNLSASPPEEIARGIAAIVAEIRRRLPEARVLLLGILPRGERPGPARDRIRAVNQLIARLDDGSRVRFLDIGRSFVDEDGTISREIMPDSLHLSPKGYRIWAEAMEPALRPLLDEPGHDPKRSEALSLGSLSKIACSSE